MRSLTSLRSRIACALAISMAALAVAAPLAQADQGVKKPSAYYLALGDSLAFGYQGYKVVPPFAESQFTTGYVDDFGAKLRTIKKKNKIINNGCPGATSTSMNSTAGCTTYPFPVHHAYGAGLSQLQDAIAFINAHPGKVSPITVNIGNNDVLAALAGCGGLANPNLIPCLAAAAPSLFGSIATNLGTALAQLRAAAPKANIIVLGTYNPFAAAGFAAANPLTQQLNSVLSSVAAGAGAKFADPFPAFNGATPQPQTICSLTLMCADLVAPAGPDGDIHASDAGYQTLADLIWDASGYAALADDDDDD